MNRVEELIQQLCPNGVEWKKLGDYIELYTGEQLNKDAMLSDGVYPVMNGGVLASGFTDSFNEEADTITISQGGASAGFVNWMESKFWAGAHCFIVKVINDKIINRYLYFFLKNSERKMMLSKYGAGIPSLSKESVNKLLIPIPPLPIQQEIVRILDTFTELTANLQTELEACKKQYAYYRDCLLNFEGVDGVEWKKLGEVCEIKGRIGFRGYTQKDLVKEEEGAITLSPSNIINECLDFSNCSYISWFKYNESPEIQAEIGDVLFTKTASVGKCALIKYLPKSATINPQLVLLKKITCNAAYLTYVLLGNKFQDEVKKVTGIGSVPNIPQSSLSQIRIPIPPLPEQRRIVAILDKFETLVNDLSVGLPAELEARRKQYEYYRDKLLTFDRV